MCLQIIATAQEEQKKGALTETEIVNLVCAPHIHRTHHAPHSCSTPLWMPWSGTRSRTCLSTRPAARLLFAFHPIDVHQPPQSTAKVLGAFASGAKSQLNLMLKLQARHYRNACDERSWMQSYCYENQGLLRGFQKLVHILYNGVCQVTSTIRSRAIRSWAQRTCCVRR